MGQQRAQLLAVLSADRHAITVAVIDLGHRRGGRAKQLNFHRIVGGCVKRVLQLPAQLHAGAQHGVFVHTGCRQQKQIPEGRTAAQLAHGDLLLVKAVVVLRRGTGNDLIFRGPCLNDRAAQF